MIGIVLVTHGGIGTEMISTLEHILSAKQENMIAIEVGASDAMQEKRREIAAAIEQVRDPIGRHGVLVITDMVGGTPSNLASKEIRGGSVMVVTGLNLPMLVTAARVRGKSSLETLARLTIEAGRKFIDVPPGGGSRGTPINE